MNRRRNAERDERTLQRHEREDAAGELLRKVPDLLTLSLAVHESRPRRIASAPPTTSAASWSSTPALLEIPCSNAYCKDGGYDVTREVLDALMSHKTHFEGDSTSGSSGTSGDCARILRYVGTATYKPRTES